MGYSPQDLWQIWLPGAVLGGLAIVAAVCFFMWLCTLCCRPHAYTYQLEWLANSPFYSSSRLVVQNVVHFHASCMQRQPLHTHTQHRERKRRNNRSCSWLLFLATLVAIGLCTWGLVEAILATDGKVTTFWNIVDDGQQQVVVPRLLLFLVDNCACAFAADIYVLPCAKTLHILSCPTQYTQHTTHLLLSSPQ